MPPAAVLEYLKESLEIVEYVIAQEKHQDEGLHVHAFIKVAKKITFNNKLFDLPEHHGNYQVAKSWKAVKKYVTKDGNYIANIDLESAEAKKGKRNAALVAMPARQAVDEGLIDLLQLEKLIKAQNVYRSL